MNPTTLARKIHGCWLGKNIGGTLGGPREGEAGLLDLSFYDPVPAQALPNDDLDLQIVFLHALRSSGAAAVTPDLLAAAWSKHVLWPPDEYGITRRNFAYGLTGSQLGAVDNYFGESMGAAIRSELWACVCAGEPDRAAAFAWADAVVDHDGDGVRAEMFHAAIQAAAFTESDRTRLIQVGLKVLPDGSRLKTALLHTLEWWEKERDWRKVRQRLVATYATGNFTDVVCNLGFELLGWLAGDGDFGASVCIAVNCGFDTDCTGATLAALLGIIDPEGIPERWRRPIGDAIVLSPLIVGVEAPPVLDVLTAWTLDLRRQLAGDMPRVQPVVPYAPESEKSSPPLLLSAEEETGVSPECRWRDAGPQGHWRRLEPASFSGDTRRFRFRFTAAADRAVKLMVFCTSGAAAWVDGQPVLDYTAADVAADTFIAPSFHRAGCTATIRSFAGPAGSVHELVVACRRPQARAADLVVGLGDPETNFWLPEAMVHRLA